MTKKELLLEGHKMFKELCNSYSYDDKARKELFDEVKENRKNYNIAWTGHSMILSSGLQKKVLQKEFDIIKNFVENFKEKTVEEMEKIVFDAVDLDIEDLDEIELIEEDEEDEEDEEYNLRISTPVNRTYKDWQEIQFNKHIEERERINSIINEESLF